jgi:hypothetical protein
MRSEGKIRSVLDRLLYTDGNNSGIISFLVLQHFHLTDKSKYLVNLASAYFSAASIPGLASFCRRKKEFFKHSFPRRLRTSNPLIIHLQPRITSCFSTPPVSPPATPPALVLAVFPLQSTAFCIHSGFPACVPCCASASASLSSASLDLFSASV